MRNRDNIRSSVSEVLDSSVIKSVVAPMPFNLELIPDGSIRGRIGDTGLKYSRDNKINMQFSILSIELLNLLPSFNKYELSIISYISTKVKYNSNLIKFNIDIIRGHGGLNLSNRVMYSDAINHLCNIGVIARSEFNGMYNVNPLVILRGNIFTFYDDYIKNIREQGYEIKALGKTIIDRVAVKDKDDRITVIGKDSEKELLIKIREAKRLEELSVIDKANNIGR